MEHGLGAVNHTSSALHTPSSSGATVNTASQVLSDVANNYHIYSMNWSPNQITFLVDGVGYYTYNPAIKDASTWPFDEDQYILLNIAMGGIAGTIDSGFTQSAMVIDYVRVYQDAPLGIEDITANKVRVFPNPASAKINLRTNLDIDYVEVYDVFGKFIHRDSAADKSIKVNGLSSGLYLLNIYSNGSRIVKKVVVN
jgi:beta-glucanase (GH16 family)